MTTGCVLSARSGRDLLSHRRLPVGWSQLLEMTSDDSVAGRHRKPLLLRVVLPIDDQFRAH